MNYTPAYTYRLAPTTSYSGNYGYSQPYYGYSTYSQPSYSTYSQPYYSYNYSRVYPQPGLGRNTESRLTYATYQRADTYSPGYSITQPYYFSGQGYGTMSQGVLPNGTSYRSWSPPSRVR